MGKARVALGAMAGLALALGAASATGQVALSGSGEECQGHAAKPQRDGDSRAVQRRRAGVLIGSRAGDRIAGTAGPDLVCGLAGDDNIRGGDGGDRLYGHEDRDTLRGEGASDLIRGGANFDRVRGGSQADDLAGGASYDELQGGSGNDAVAGGSGSDNVAGGGGRDRVLGGRGRDQLDGGPGIDRVDGGPGRDTVAGGKGPDRLDGGPGDDLVNAVDLRDSTARSAGSTTGVGGARRGSADFVACGPGNDEARVDVTDQTQGCEDVSQFGATATFALPAWGDGTWGDPAEFSTIQTGDLDGDGDAELLGRGSTGVQTHVFEPPSGQFQLASTSFFPLLSDSEGWAQPQYYETIQTGDINGDGRDEVLGRGVDGIFPWQISAGRPTSCDPAYNPQPDPAGCALEPHAVFRNADICSPTSCDPQYYSTIQALDIDGDGADEIIGRDSGGIHEFAYLGNPAGSSKCTPPPGSHWCEMTPLGLFSNANGFSQPQFYSVIQGADIDGDGREEIIGRYGGGIFELKYVADKPDPHCASFVPGTNQAWCALPELGLLSDSEGWSAEPFYSTIQTADIDGDGREEIIARAEDGIHQWKYVADQPNYACPHARVGAGGSWCELDALGLLSDSEGWSAERFYSTIQAADLDGDGRDEILARSADGLDEWTYKPAGGCAQPTGEGGSWCELAPLGVFTDIDGWNDPSHYSTIQTADVNGDGRAEVLARGPTGMVTFAFGNGEWSTPSAEAPAYAPGSPEAAAYEVLNCLLAPANPNFDVRDHYDDEANVSNYRTTLEGYKSAPPTPSQLNPTGNARSPCAYPLADVKQGWPTVQSQVSDELNAAVSVASWFGPTGHLQTMSTDDTTISSGILNTVYGHLQQPPNKTPQLIFDVFDGLMNLVSGVVSVIPGGAVATGLLSTAWISIELVDVGLNDGWDETGTEPADSIQGSVAALDNQLIVSYQQALDGFGNAYAAITSDYGLMMAVGEMIGSQIWETLATGFSGDDPPGTIYESQIRETIAKHFTIQAWKAVGAWGWVVKGSVVNVQFAGGDDCCQNDPGQRYPSCCDYTSPDGNYWSLYTNEFKVNLYSGQWVSSDLRSQLFNPTEQTPGQGQSCLGVPTTSDTTPAWNPDACYLDQPADMVLALRDFDTVGAGGWELPRCLWSKSDFTVTHCPSGTQGAGPSG